MLTIQYLSILYFFVLFYLIHVRLLHHLKSLFNGKYCISFAKYHMDVKSLDIGTESIGRFDRCRNYILCYRHYCIGSRNTKSTLKNKK